MCIVFTSTKLFIYIACRCVCPRCSCNKLNWSELDAWSVEASVTYSVPDFIACCCLWPVVGIIQILQCLDDTPTQKNHTCTVKVGVGVITRMLNRGQNV